VLFGKSPEDQQFLTFVAGELSLEERAVNFR
jgi:hypothetical protein